MTDAERKAAHDALLPLGRLHAQRAVVEFKLAHSRHMAAGWKRNCKSYREHSTYWHRVASNAAVDVSFTREALERVIAAARAYHEAGSTENESALLAAIDDAERVLEAMDA